MATRIAFIITILSVTSLMGCEISRPVDTYDGSTSAPVVCSMHAVDSFELEHESKGTFISPEYTVYDAILTYQEETDRLSNTTSITMLSAKDVAEISYWVVSSYEDMLRENPDMALTMAGSDEVYSLINYSHFHILHQDDEFFRLWDAETQAATPEVFDDSFIMAFVRLGGCLAPAGDANFSSFYRSRYYFTKEDPSIVIHELMHMVSLAATGDSDPEHAQEWLWKDYGEETVAGDAEKLFLENHVN